MYGKLVPGSGTEGVKKKILNSAFLSLDTEHFLVKLGPNTGKCLGTIPNVHCALVMRL